MQDRDWDSINYYNNRIEYCQDCIALDESSVGEIEERLERLEEARKRINYSKEDAWLNCSEFERKKADLDCQTFWSGAEWRSCCESMGYVLDNYRSYCRSIDRIEDSLIDEITSCRRRLADLQSDINWLEKVIYDCRGWLNKLWN